MVAPHSALERVLRATEGDLPVDFARRILALSFSAHDQARYLELSEKVQLDQLTELERMELDDLLVANDVLTILKAKAQISLNNASAA